MVNEPGPASSSAAKDFDESARVQRETVVVIDFGSQYSMLIARRVRESNVYCEIIPHTADWDSVARLTEGTYSRRPRQRIEPKPRRSGWVYDSGLPRACICYGMQAMAHRTRRQGRTNSRKEYGQPHARNPTASLFKVPTAVHAVGEPRRPYYGDPTRFRISCEFRKFAHRGYGQRRWYARPAIPP